MSLPSGQGPGAIASGRFTGRWRYDRTTGRGIALCYDRGVRGLLAARCPDVHVGGCLTGRWRYNRLTGRGIALSYERSLSAAPVAPTPAPTPTPASTHTEPISPDVSHSPIIRVLCSCGEVFAFEGDAGACPRCGRDAGWPTMGVVEREMRSDLEELLQEHEPGPDPG